MVALTWERVEVFMSFPFRSLSFLAEVKKELILSLGSPDYTKIAFSSWKSLLRGVVSETTLASVCFWM